MQQPDHDSLPDAPPLSRAADWFRTLLWLMPTCVAVTTLLGGDALSRWWFPALSRHGVFLWLLINFTSTIALGIFRAKLNQPRWDGLAPRFDPVEVVRFVVMQIFIVPVLAYFIGFALIVVGILE